MKVYKMRSWVSLLVAACVLLPVAAFAAPNARPLLVDASAPQISFTAVEAYGFVKYRKSYSGQQDRIVVVNFVVPKGARLQCMDYDDFTFALHRQSGDIVPHVALVALSGAAAPPVYNIIPPRAVGTPAPCPYGSRTNGLFVFDLEQLYPKLDTGLYQLAITFRPRDKSVVETPFPVVSFTIEK
jgi:hypothetical protein